MVALGIVGLGQSFAILVGDVDLCVGGIISLITVLCARYMQDSGASIALMVILCMLVGIFIGMINGFLASVIPLDAMVTTFASNSVLLGFALWLMPAPGGSVPYSYMKWIEIQIFGIPLPIFILFALLIASWFILDRCVLGFHIRAVGGAPHSAFTSGISITKTKIITHAITGFLAALAGLFLSSRMGSGDALSGVPFSLDSMTAVIAGGTNFASGVGSVFGTTVAAFLITVLGNIFNHLGVSTYWQYVFKGLLLVIAVTGAAVRVRLNSPKRRRAE